MAARRRWRSAATGGAMRSGATSRSTPCRCRATAWCTTMSAGLADLDARRVRFIGDAAARIAEDYLRILRFFRFHAAYGEGEPDPAALHACIAARDGLASLSRERVRMELLKLLVARRAGEAVGVMADAGLLVTILGGVPYLRPFEKMTAIEAASGEKPDAVRRLGALAVFVAEDARASVRAASPVECGARPAAQHGGRVVACRRRPDAAGRPRAALSAWSAGFARSRAARLEPVAGCAGRSALARSCGAAGTLAAAVLSDRGRRSDRARCSEGTGARSGPARGGSRLDRGRFPVRSRGNCGDRRSRGRESPGADNCAHEKSPGFRRGF